MQRSKTVIQHSSVSRLSHHHNQLERSAERPLKRSKHSTTCPISCGSSFCRYTLLPGLGCSTRSHGDSYSDWFSQRRRHRPTNTVFVTGSVDGQCSSPRSKNSDGLCSSCSTSLQSTQTTHLPFPYHLLVRLFFSTIFSLFSRLGAVP